MTGTAIDFSNVKGLEPLPIGEYSAVITKADLGTSKAGNTKIDLEWTIQTGPNANKKVFDSLVFSQKTEFRVKKTLIGLGFPKDFKGEITTEMLVGKSAILTLEIEQSTQLDPETDEPYPPRNRVRSVKQPGGKAEAKPAKK